MRGFQCLWVFIGKVGAGDTTHFASGAGNRFPVVKAERVRPVTRHPCWKPCKTMHAMRDSLPLKACHIRTDDYSVCSARPLPFLAQCSLLLSTVVEGMAYLGLTLQRRRVSSSVYIINIDCCRF